MPQPHRTVIIFATDLHRRLRKLSLLSSSLFPSDQPKSRSYQTHPRSMIYKPILSPLPPLDPPTDLAAIRPTYQSHRCQTHPPILPPSNPLTNLWSLTSLFLSVYLSLSLSLSHDRCLYLRKTEFFFFLLCFIVDLVYIFRFPIIIFVWKLRKCVFQRIFRNTTKHLKSFSFMKNIFI